MELIRSGEYIPLVHQSIDLYIIALFTSERTISRRRRDYHLKSSHQTTQELPETTKRQFVLDELERDPLHRKGPDIIKESIRLNTGFDLTR